MKLITREFLAEIWRHSEHIRRVIPENGMTLLEFLNSNEFCHGTKMLVAEKVLPTGLARWVQMRMIDRANQMVGANQKCDKINLWGASSDASVACVYAKIDFRVEQKLQLDDVRIAFSVMSDSDISE